MGGSDGEGSDVKRITIESLQPGYIILTARQGKGSKFIRGATGGMVSHAMICVELGFFIDSTMDGVQACGNRMGARPIAERSSRGCGAGHKPRSSPKERT